MATPVSQMTPIPNKDAFRSGMRAGIPVAVGYIPIAIAFGLLAKSFDMPNVITLAMSLFIFAGASQFIGVQLIMAGSMYWEIILTTFILNLRHFLMSASLSQRLETTSNRFLAAIAFGVTDETFSVASTRDESTRGHFVLGLNLIAFLAWNVGTWIGVFLAFGLPASVQTSMGIALYAMFIGLLIPSLTRKPVIVVAGIAVLADQSVFARPGHGVRHIHPAARSAALAPGHQVAAVLEAIFTVHALCGARQPDFSGHLTGDEQSHVRFSGWGRCSSARITPGQLDARRHRRHRRGVSR